MWVSPVFGYEPFEKPVPNRVQLLKQDQGKMEGFRHDPLLLSSASI